MTTANSTVCSDKSIRYMRVTDSTLEPRYRQGEVMMIDLAKQPTVGDDVIARAEAGRIVGCVVAFDDTGVTLQKYGTESNVITLTADAGIQVVAGAIAAHAWERLQATA